MLVYLSLVANLYFENTAVKTLKNSTVRKTVNAEALNKRTKSEQVSEHISKCVAGGKSKDQQFY